MEKLSFDRDASYFPDLASIQNITCHRRTQGGHVHSDLVGASSLKINFHE